MRALVISDGEHYPPVVRDALAALPMADLTIEDPPLEEVMRELFTAQRVQRQTAATAEAAR